MNLNIYEKEYSCRTKDHLWFQELKQAIFAIVNNGYKIEDIERESEESNFFSAASLSRAREIKQAVIRRLAVASDSFLDFYVKQSVTDQKLLSLVLIIADDRTFYELMNNVIKEKFIVGDTVLKDNEIIGYLHDLQSTNERAAHWTDVSIKKVRSLYKGMLKDSGLAKVNGREMTLVKPILSDEFRSFLLAENLEPILKILAGER